MRTDGRGVGTLREVKITPNFLRHPHGSSLIEVGKTRVVCSVILEESVPPWLKGKKSGWLTAEYSMLPGSSGQRIRRERTKVGGRTQEIQRLIGRSLRSCLDLNELGERSLQVDCDVLDADGGTRTAAITGAYVALVLALKKLESTIPGISGCLKLGVAAVSVGLLAGEGLLDLNYEEDLKADVDMNVVKTSTGKFIEVQGTAEADPFDTEQLSTLLSLADAGITKLGEIQKSAIG